MSVATSWIGARAGLLLLLLLAACRREASPGAADASPPPSSPSSSVPPPSVVASAVPKDGGPPAPPPFDVERALMPRRGSPFTGTAVAFASIRALAESAPEAYVLDGDLAEWNGPPDAVLPPEHGRAKLWFAFTERGLIVAGELDAHAGPIALDKLRLDLAFTPPELPPLAFVNHINGEVVDEKWCRTEGQEDFGGATTKPPPIDLQEACLDWLAKSLARRDLLAARFLRTLVVDLSTGAATGAPGVVVRQAKDPSGGTRFELELPSASFPETSEMPLHSVRLAARAFSNRRALSPSGGADANAPSGDALLWSTFVLKRELRLHRLPELVERIALHPAYPRDALIRVAFGYVPAPTSGGVSFYVNKGMAGQWAPASISPTVTDLDVAKGRRLSTLPACGAGDGGTTVCGRDGEVELWAHPAWVDDGFRTNQPHVALVSRRGKTVIDVSEITSYDPYTIVKRDPGLVILNVNQGVAGPYGSGPGGMMTGYGFSIFTMKDSGHFEPTTELELAVWRSSMLGLNGIPILEDMRECGGASLKIDPALRSFGLLATMGMDTDAGLEWRNVDVGYRFDPATRTYVKYGRLLPVPDAGTP